MERRSGDFFETLLDKTYRETPEFVPKSKLCHGGIIIGRMLSFCKRCPGRLPVKKEDASIIVAKEMRTDWIAKNIYPADERSVARAIQREYDTFRNLLKELKRKDRPLPKDWHQRTTDFNNRMFSIAYDIRTKSAQYEKNLELEFGVKMTSEDEAFWHDNCHGDYVTTCSATVPRHWAKQKRRLIERQNAIDEKISPEAISSTMELDYDDLINNESDMDVDMEYIPDTSLRTVNSKTYPPSTLIKENSEFPKVKIRDGYKSIQEPIMRCMVQCLSDYKVTTSDLLGITVQVANTIFGQSWRGTSPDTDDDDSDDDDDVEMVQGTPAKCRKKVKDLSFVMPSRKSIGNYLEDASMMNLKMVAQYLSSADKKDNVVTVGLDDTTKAAGHRKFDVKTDHVTIANATNGTKKSFTTGYVENKSHSGKDGAEAYDMKLKSLAILADTSVDDIKSNIDFWITDRAADCSTMLKELDVPEEKVLKCSAHLLLCIDHAIDKTYKQTENLMGQEKIINAANILKNSSTSLHTTGLIALAKLLSPSHAAHCVSLYSEYKDWLLAKNIDTGNSFRGFVSNRFGRILELGNEFIKQKDSLMKFFESVVDENSNRLVLAVYTFITNSWFLCCSEIYSLLGELLINPLMDKLGIDGRGEKLRCNWNDLKTFFASKLPELDNLQVDFAKTATGKGRLIGACLLEITEALRRQLSAMQFFVEDDDNEMDLEKLQLAPVTNLGCESNFAKLDNRVRASGGMTTVKTHSMKTVVATNRLLVDSSFVDMNADQKYSYWKWGRSSKAVQDVKLLEKDFIETIRATKRLSIQKKEQLKKQKQRRMMTILDTCKSHGGPVTASNLDLINKLTEKQLITEISYLRLTVCPDVRQKRRLKTNTGFRYQTLTKEELKNSIKQAIKPSGNDSDDIDGLLRKVLTF